MKVSFKMQVADLWQVIYKDVAVGILRLNSDNTWSFRSHEHHVSGCLYIDGSYFLRADEAEAALKLVLAELGY